MKVEELKERARRHELREEWQKAYDLYSTALRIQDEDEAPDITLYNRVGDIQTRLGQINGAVEHYEKAIDLYLEAELPNNAIAICKKVLRNLPDRNIFFLRMGQIRAAQGFLTDARQNFLAYAERQTTTGDIESALNALIEFVEISPEDLEIRRGLASQLESHGRTDEAVEHYVDVHRRLTLAGAEEDAQAVAEKLAALAPDLVLPDADAIREGAGEPETSELLFESTNLGGLEIEEWGDEESRFARGVTEVAEGPSETVAPGDAGLGYPVSGSDPDLGVEEGLDPSIHVGDRDEAVPAFGFGEEEGEGEAEFPPGFGAESLGLGALEQEDIEEEATPLPLIGFDDVEDEAMGFEGDMEGPLAEDALPFLDLEDEPEEGEPGTSFPAESLEPDLPVDSLDHKAAADRGDMDLAMARVRGVIRLEPANVELHQRLVEYAFRKNDQDVLLGAYLDLAGCLARTGAPLKARAVYQQVLSLSPGHEEASRGIRELDGTPESVPPAQVASSEEYVDLGSLILGDDAERTTRWTVAAEAPSGDEEADFAKMLSQFKEKVSEHVAADDVSAHHDLGTAYMEMGLLDEAIGEFQMALRASPKHLPTHEVMGRCWMEMGKPDMAILALNRALTVPYEVEDELIGIYYLLGRAHEDRGNREGALEFYERVFSLDINFEDVTERLRALR